MKINIGEAKAQFYGLLRRVAAGGEVTICRAGKPVARLVPATGKKATRPMGFDKGKVWMADDFDEPDPKLEALFHAPVTSSLVRKGKRRN